MNAEWWIISYEVFTGIETWQHSQCTAQKEKAHRWNCCQNGTGAYCNSEMLQQVGGIWLSILHLGWRKSQLVLPKGSFVSILWDLPASLCWHKLYLRNLLITGLLLENGALRWAGKDRAKVDYSTQSCAYMLNLYFSKRLHSGYSAVHHSWRAAQCSCCLWGHWPYFPHITQSLSGDRNQHEDRLIIFSIFISFFSTHHSSIQPLQNFNEFHILPMIWVDIVLSCKKMIWGRGIFISKRTYWFWVPSLKSLCVP